jgi:sterol desaturase/sphingolipid hydroxylase (fatty acid hydroxylase superfamily)
MTTTLAALAILITLAFTREPLAAIAVLFVVIVPFERIFPRHRQKFRRPHLGTDLAYALLSTPLNFIGVAAGLALAVLSTAWVPALLLRPVVGSLPGPARVLVGLLLFDLVIYWGHRASHEIGFLWRFHSVHHSTEHLDWVSGFRTHPFDGILIAPPFVFLVVAGFSPEFSGVLLVVQAVLGLFLHANVRWRLRPLHRFVITPEFHHWHHSNEADAHHTNYSVFLPVWDIVFRTYRMPADRRPTVYGVTPQLPDGIAAQLVHPLRGLRADHRNGQRWVAPAQR